MTYRKNPKVVYRELGSEDGGVLLHLETGRYHGVNAIGALVWRLLDDRPDPSTLAEAMRDVVDEIPPDAGHLVEAFLEDLRARDLVTPAGEG